MKMFTTKITGFILSLTLILSSAIMPKPIAYADEINRDAMKTVDLFRSLGVIPDYYDYNIDLGKEVTRADFVHSVFKLVGPEDYKGTKTYYYDVPENYWAYDAVSYLTEIGIIEGSDTKIFKPDEVIEQAAAYKIMVSLMGYGEYAVYDGGYPYGYVNVATMLEINKDCSKNRYLTYEDMLMLLFNSATSGIFEPVSFKGDYAVYAVSEDKTLFSVYRGLYYQRGIVEGANMTSISAVEPSKEDEAVVDGEVYKTDIELYDYLGEEVEILYSYKKSSDEKTITWAYRTGKTDVVTVKADNDATFRESDFTLKYLNENDKDKTLRIDKNIRMIFNGGDTNRSVADILNLPRYEAKFVIKERKTTVAIVNVPEVLVVGNINNNEEKVYDLKNPTKSISLNPDDYDYLSIMLQGKEPIECKDLSIGNVLSLYASEDGERLEVKVGNTTKEGEITQIYEDEFGTFYTIDGVEYYQPGANSDFACSPGDFVILYLDVQGEVAYIKAGAVKSNAAFLIKAKIGESDNGEALYIRLMGQDGVVSRKDCFEKVTIDGFVYKEVEAAYRALCGDTGEFLPQLALVSYNNDGQITDIDTATCTERESEYTLSVNVPYKENQLYKTFGQIGSMSPVDNNTVFFGVPNDALLTTAEDEDFFIVKRSELLNDTRVSYESYKIVPKSEIEQYVVLKGYSNKEPLRSELPVLVTDITVMLNSDNEAVDCLKGYQGTEEVSILANEGCSLSTSGIEEGDLVRIRKNNAGEIVNVTLAIDYDKLDTATTSDADVNKSYRFVVGYAHDIVGNVIKIGETDPAVCTHVASLASVPVLIYDSQLRKPVVSGEVGDAETYYNNGADCSRVVLLTKALSPALLVIYK